MASLPVPSLLCCLRFLLFPLNHLRLILRFRTKRFVTRIFWGSGARNRRRAFLPSTNGLWQYRKLAHALRPWSC